MRHQPEAIVLEVTHFAHLPTTGESSKIHVTIDNHKAYRWSGIAYVEISGSLVLGTSAGTAYDGASGQANADLIATEQAQFGLTGTGGLGFVVVGSAGTLQIDMQRATAETSFDGDEVMLIETTAGALCRITKQQLQSSINTDTTYTEGANIYINDSNVIKLYDAISTNSVEANTNLTLRAQTTNNVDYLNSIIFQNTATFKTIALTRRYDSSMAGGTTNFCIQIGTGGTLDDTKFPIR